MLKEKLQKELSLALKEKNEARLSVLRMTLAAVNEKERKKRYEASLKGKEDNGGLSDSEIIDVISSEAKKRKESIKEFREGQREDLAQKEEEELKVLEEYLPEQMSQEELAGIVKEVIAEMGAKEVKDMGRVIPEVIKRTKGRAEGSEVSRLVKESLFQ